MNPLETATRPPLPRRRRCRLAACPPPAFGLEARVLAAWRSSRGGRSLWDTGVLIRGLALAGVLMVVSIWPAVSQSGGTRDGSNLQLADSTVQTYLSQ